MVLFNYSTREITAKIVYYGPGLCGKTTNLQYIHENLPDQVRGKMLSLATKTDRTLFFDFLPIDLGEIRGMKTRVQLYTVPGQVFYNETRKLVLKGADGIVFVADSQETMLGANVESYKNLEENLRGHGLQLNEIPHVIQFNKRDLPRLAAIEDLNSAINKHNAPFYESVAVTGIGVQDTLKAIVKLVLLNLTRKYDPKASPGEERPVAAAAPARPVVLPQPAPVASPSSSMPTVEARPVSAAVPVAPRGSVETPVSAGGRGVPSTPFRADEIDGLVGEVEDGYSGDGAGRTDRPAWRPEPATAAAPEVRAESAGRSGEGTWMGSPDEAAPAAFGRAESMFGAATNLDDVADAPLSEPATFHPPADAAGGSGRAVSGSSAAPRGGAAQRAGGSPAPPMSGAEVVLTEVVGDAALFADPSLEVAVLDPGEARDIVVPVQLGEGKRARRFKLSIRLRLDPLE